MKTYDLVVIGSGPGGHKAAIQAAKLGKEVCVIEKMDVVGGVAINTGTIPSKALREAVVDFLSARKSLMGMKSTGAAAYQPFDRKTTLRELMNSCQRVIRAEIDVVRSQFASNGIELRHGWGSLAGDGLVNIRTDDNAEVVRGHNILVATGTSPARPSSVPFDNKQVFTSDDILKIENLPATMIVVGGGVIGTEYASMLGALGVRVTLIEGRPRLLEFLDNEICEALQYHLRQAGVTLRLGEKVVSIKKTPAAPGDSGRHSAGELVEATLESGKIIRAECLMYCIGRQGATEKINLDKVGLRADERGRIKVNENFQALAEPVEKGKPGQVVPGIYAVGDVIGFPALASTSMEQGRLAACHMFGEHAPSVAELFPYGIYSVPEISMVGWTEERLTQAGIPYEAGIAQYKETARGHLLDDEIGMLKILVHQESHAILGAHCIGTSATELIHIGQAVMAFKGTVEYFINTVFNYPTLAECYKVAAFNAYNKLKSR